MSELLRSEEQNEAGKPSDLDVVEAAVEAGELTATDEFVLAALRRVLAAHRAAEDRIERLKHQVGIDSLTGLLTRDALMERLESMLGELNYGERVGDPIALLIVFTDNDGFKLVNDKYDHSVGDEVLRQTADVLRASVRDGTPIGRFGGDEFFLVVPVANPQRDKKADITRAEMVEAVDQATSGLAQRFQLATDRHNSTQPDELLHVKFSWGVIPSFYGDADTAAELLARADRNMIEAKKRRRETSNGASQ